PDEQLGNRLRAFVVIEADGPSGPELKKHCAERVPHYMVPDAVEFRPVLPKTSTGKIDRKALERDEPAVAAAPVAGGPRGARRTDTPAAPWLPTSSCCTRPACSTSASATTCCSPTCRTRTASTSPRSTSSTHWASSRSASTCASRGCARRS